ISINKEKLTKVQYNSRCVFTHNQVPLWYASDLSILLHHPSGAPRSLSKNNPVDGFAFARRRTNPDHFSQQVPHAHRRDFIPIYNT
ncbi:unnamed protein product, partial [Bubo scandiacus]